MRGMACTIAGRRRAIGLLLALALLLATLGADPAVAAPLPGHPQSSGATYYYSLPDGAWQDLVVYAHGYISPYAPPWTPETDSIEGTTLGQIVTGLGYAFATTTYPGPGLIVPQAVEDVARLVGEFAAEYGKPRRVFIVGPSEGGLVATLSLERHPEVFSGGMAICGPIGSFQRQLDYFSGFQVVFNYFFPGLVPGSPAGIPMDVVNGWKSAYVPVVEQAVSAEPGVVSQLLAVTQLPYDPSQPATIARSVVDVLTYNVLATNDATAKLGGLPFGNQGSVYTGSGDDAQLNAGVERFTANQAALDTVAAGFETTGRLTRPLVDIHTTMDPIIPVWHADLYQAKVEAAGAGRYLTTMKPARYGHCNVTALQVTLGFLAMVTSPELPFPDVPDDHPYHAAIQAMASARIINGYVNGDFGPADPVKRAQFAKMIVGAMGIPVTEGVTSPFADLGPNDPASLYPQEYVAAAYADAIVTGRTTTEFAPYDPVSRAQMVTMIVRAAQSLKPGLLQTPPAEWQAQVAGFSDVHDQNLRLAEYNGLLAGLQGYGSAWDPWADATRGECAQALWHLMDLM